MSYIHRCGLCAGVLTETFDEGKIILESAAGGTREKDLCASCYAHLNSNWNNFVITVMHAET